MASAMEQQQQQQQTTLEFYQAMADFKNVFPQMDDDVIEAVLRSNQGAVDTTIDQLLTMSTDNENEKIRSELEQNEKSPSTSKSQKAESTISLKSIRKWQPALLGPLPDTFLLLPQQVCEDSLDSSCLQENLMLEDERIAIFLQNEEFMAELRWNEDFLSTLENDTKIQGTSLENCGNQIGHDDEDLFKERLKNMGKEHMRMSGMYWGLTALDLMGKLEETNRNEVLEFIAQCQTDSGGIAASLQHDPHILYTLSAVQILCIYNALDTIDIERVVKYVKERQQPDGSFTGDIWGEVDTRFSFCAVATLSLLNRLDAIDVDKAVEFVMKCMNFDGGFGSKPGAESHAGMIYCSIGLLSITGNLHLVDADQLSWWLCERQLPSGGLNGRPEKLPDVCYSWWVLSALTILGRLHWVDKEQLVKFVLACQDTESGGFSDRPGDIADPFHTLFGLTALSLLNTDYPLKKINPTYCMPEYVIQRLHLKPARLDQSN